MWTGTPAVFVRLAGCNLACDFCDTDYSTKLFASADEVVEKVRESGGDCPMVILTGGELNSEIEHQTAIDTTIGVVKPIGERGATMADTVGKAFTTSPREAADWFTAFGLRQVGYVMSFLRRIGRFAA